MKIVVFDSVVLFASIPEILRCTSIEIVIVIKTIKQKSLLCPFGIM